MELASYHRLAPSILRRLPHFWKLCAPPAIWIHEVQSTLQLYSLANMAIQNCHCSLSCTARYHR